MMRRTVLVAILFMVAVPVLGAADKDCATLLASSSERPEATAREFDVSTVTDLDLAIIFPWKLAKDWRRETHSLRVSVINPRGHVYQNIEATFVVEGKGRHSSLYQPGQGEPAEAEWVPIGKEKSLRVKVRLPVAGSSIMQNSMYGEWRIEAEVDGHVLSCGDERSRFVIR